MIQIGITQLEYSSTSEGPMIHIFGRTEKGEAKRIDVESFRPYFYIAEEESKNIPRAQLELEDKKYISIRGEPVRRVYTQKPSDVRELREKYSHYEADVLFTTRFMIDNGLTGGVSIPSERVHYTECKSAEVVAPARVCLFDIECDDSKGWPDPEKSEITCITCHDSFEDDYVTFLLSSREGAEEEICRRFDRGVSETGCFGEKHSVLVYPLQKEKEMLQELARYITERNFDIVSGWNVTGFDIPYLLKRMEHLGVSLSSIARLPSSSSDRVEIRGRAIFDLLLGYQKMHLQKRESYRLDAIAEYELGEHKFRYTGTIGNLWREDPVHLVEYNYVDVQICVSLDRKDAIVNFFRELARYAGCPLDKTTSSSSIVDTYVLRKAHGKFVLPSKGTDVAVEKFEGAAVFEPSLGLRENVVVLDLKSLYPMITMTINASPDTKDPNGDLRASNGIRFKKFPDGLSRGILMNLLKERDARKAERNKFAFGSPEYKRLNMEQDVLKIIMNTYYGVSGHSKFRLADREIGAAITSVGRAILEHTRRVIEQQGYKVVYGDTDGCFVHIPDEDRESTIKIARILEKALNASYDEFAKKELNADSHYFSIKFEKIYSRFFQGGKKKRYAGLLTWKEGVEAEEVDVVGFEVKRSDSPQVTRTTQKEVMRLILFGKGYDAIRDYIRGVVKKYRACQYSLDEIGIPGGIGKNLEDYETNDAQVRGAKYANENFGANFGKGSKPKRIYIKAVTGKYPRTDVICFEYGDQVPKEFIVDRDVMLEKTLEKPLSRILEALDWGWSSMDPAVKTFGDWESEPWKE